MQSIHSIIALSGSLALGFLLVVLAVALYGVWTPLLAALLFSAAHLPLVSAQNDDDFTSETTSNESTKFLSTFLLTSAIAMPLVLTHANCMPPMAALLTETGGLAIYGTIVLFSSFFTSSSSNSF